MGRKKVKLICVECGCPDTCGCGSEEFGQREVELKSALDDLWERFWIAKLGDVNDPLPYPGIEVDPDQYIRLYQEGKIKRIKHKRIIA